MKLHTFTSTPDGGDWLYSLSNCSNSNRLTEEFGSGPSSTTRSMTQLGFHPDGKLSQSGIELQTKLSLRIVTTDKQEMTIV